MGKYIIGAIFLLGLWYMILPSGKVEQDSQYIKYLTNDRRYVIINKYHSAFQDLHCSSFRFLNVFCYVKPFRINHSTLLAASFFDPKQKSTYLEEYYYPLRGSVIVNGYEPYDEKGKAFNKYSEPLIKNGKNYYSEVTIKYYTSTSAARVFIYLLIWIVGYWMIKIIRAQVSGFRY